MNKVVVFSNKGSKLKEVEFEAAKYPVSLATIAQAVRVISSNSHQRTHKVKTRSEVKISKRKIYRQKGTGNARHGAKSAPIFVGGGVAHGPTGIKRYLKLPKKIKNVAFRSSLALKAKDNFLALIEGLSDVKKTSDAFNLIKKVSLALGMKSSGRATVVLAKRSGLKAFRNLKGVSTLLPDGLNTLKVVEGGLLLIDQAALDKLDGLFGSSLKKFSTRVEENKSRKKIVKSEAKLSEKRKVIKVKPKRGTK